MNLADAIRQAALRQAEDQGPKENPMSSQPQPSEGQHFNAPQDQPNPAPQTPETPAAFAPHHPEPAPQFQVQQNANPTPAEPAFTPQAPAEAHEDVFESAMEQEAASWGNDTGKLTITTDPNKATEFFAADSGTGEPVPMPEVPPGLAGGNAVRFEIFLSPEQLSCLFRALVATQHSMMTLREAANYLRIPAATLEQLAAEGKIPALQLEGRWRFPKSGVDEWVMLQSFREGEVNDAA